MNSTHIAERMELLRRAIQRAEATGSPADWAIVHNMQQELKDQHVSIIWSLLGEIGELKRTAKAKEAARLLEEDQL